MDDLSVRILENGDIRVTNKYDLKIILDLRKKNGKDHIYKNKLYNPRKRGFHNYYWMGMTALSVCFGGSKKYWHNKMLELFVVGESFYNKLTGNWVREDPSTAWENMDQLKFEEFQKEAWNHFSLLGVDMDWLIDNYY